MKLNISSRQKAIGLLSICIIGYALLLFLPADHFDEGESVCVSVVLFDMECYACGMTRGIQHLIHFDFKEAWEYNKLAFIVFPLAVYLISSQIYQLFKAKDAE